MSDRLKVTGSFSSSNYFEASQNIDSFNTLNVSTQVGDVTFSAGVGTNTSYKPNATGYKTSMVPAIEAKVKYNITDNLNAQARFRKIGDTEQYRVAFGGSYNINNNNSIYAAAHLTNKQTSISSKTNTGAWVGYTHNFGGCSLSAELQQNIPFKGKVQSGDTMFNLMFSIPF